MSGHKLNNSDALKFMFAGNSTFTVVNTRTENRFTFKVKKSKDKDSNLFFVSVLTGPDTYTYLGTAVEGVYRHGKKSEPLSSVVLFSSCKLLSGLAKLSKNIPNFLISIVYILNIFSTFVETNKICQDTS